MSSARQGHWREYLMEGALLGAFMVSAGVFTILIFHPGSPFSGRIGEGLAQRVLMGLAMGATAFALIHSGWGRRTGAHFNPAVTLAFLRLGKIAGPDAIGYMAAHFAGAAAGMGLLGLALGPALSHPSVDWAVTRPGPAGPPTALAAEAGISFVLMMTVLLFSNAPALAGHTGLAASCLVALWIVVESPVSGMSMNPARTFGSAALAGVWDSFWVYLLTPPLAMLAAAEVYRASRGAARVLCAKLHHDSTRRCIFRCGYPMTRTAASGGRA